MMWIVLIFATAFIGSYILNIILDSHLRIYMMALNLEQFEEISTENKNKMRSQIKLFSKREKRTLYHLVGFKNFNKIYSVHEIIELEDIFYGKSIVRKIIGRIYAKRWLCDSCEGTFTINQINPTSGDWWMCDDCFENLMKEIENERDNQKMAAQDN